MRVLIKGSKRHCLQAQQYGDTLPYAQDGYSVSYFSLFLWKKKVIKAMERRDGGRNGGYAGSFWLSLRVQSRAAGA